MPAAQDVQRRQLAGLLDAQPGLQQQLQQRPVPERVDLLALRDPRAGPAASCGLGVLPAPRGERAELRNLALEVEDRGDLALRLAATGLLKADADEVVALQRHRRRRPLRETASRPRSAHVQMSAKKQRTLISH